MKSSHLVSTPYFLDYWSDIVLLHLHLSSPDELWIITGSHSHMHIFLFSSHVWLNS
jgi:hypothetical protein